MMVFTPKNISKIYPIILIAMSIAVVCWYSQIFHLFTNRIDNSNAGGLLVSIVLLGMTIWVFTTLESSTLQIVSCVVGLCGAFSFWGIRLYFSESKNIATYVAEAYLHKEGSYTYNKHIAHDVRNDVFDPDIGQFLLNEKTLRTNLLHHLNTRTFGFQAPGDLRDHELAWVLLAHFRYSKVATETWLQTIEGRALGANLLRVEFAPSGHAKWTSLMKVEAPYSIMRERTWTDLPKWFVKALPSTPDRFRKAGILLPAEITAITRSIIDNRNTATKLELEAAMLSVVSFPQDISDTEISALLKSLMNHKEIFAHNLEELEKMRQAVRATLQKNGHTKKTLGFSIESDSSQHLKDLIHGCSEKELSKLVTSFGFTPAKGNDITFICSSKSYRLRSSGEYTIPATTHTKRVVEEYNDWSSQGLRTRYRSKDVVVGETPERTVAASATIRRDVNIQWRTSFQGNLMKGVSTTVELDHQYWKPGETYYSQQTPGREALWLYSIPRSMFY